MSDSETELLVERMQSLGESFRRLRLAENVSQETLAARADVGLSTLKRLERGEGCNLSALVQLLESLAYADQFESFFAQLAENASKRDSSLPESRRRASSPRPRESR
ncbi:helix-turn-helix domain-containing protein [Microbulbifer hainanensis]|uniref:helix-turn-helix domain-containing protein n=1 Tax=Microbulbifer hainanensis TaxID=2735675 RepID=UPI00186713A0|nr:helix-turn-helix transcriptional regulator [Microbulbifer hainanensis]